MDNSTRITRWFKDNLYWRNISFVTPRRTKGFSQPMFSISIVCNPLRAFLHWYPHPFVFSYELSVLVVVVAVFFSRSSKWNNSAKRPLNKMTLWPFFARQGPHARYLLVPIKYRRKDYQIHKVKRLVAQVRNYNLNATSSYGNIRH